MAHPNLVQATHLCSTLYRSPFGTDILVPGRFQLLLNSTQVLFNSSQLLPIDDSLLDLHSLLECSCILSHLY